VLCIVREDLDWGPSRPCGALGAYSCSSVARQRPLKPVILKAPAKIRPLSKNYI